MADRDMRAEEHKLRLTPIDALNPPDAVVFLVGGPRRFTGEAGLGTSEAPA